MKDLVLVVKLLLPRLQTYIDSVTEINSYEWRKSKVNFIAGYLVVYDDYGKDISDVTYC